MYPKRVPRVRIPLSPHFYIAIMKSKAASIVLLFIIWSLGSGWYYVCKIKGQCPGEPELEMVTKEGVTFDYGDSQPILSSSFDSYKNNLISKMDSNNLLKIVGLYDPREVNSSSFDNLGVARAMAIQNLFAEVDQSRFTISSKQLQIENSGRNVNGVEFIILTKNDIVQETEFGAIVYLHNDSINPKLNAFLIYLAKENPNNSIDVVGHWDNSETAAASFSKALDHANIIVSLLAAEGLASQNLNPTSKGETEPIADNTTIEGRAKNRRVEILIN
jgi:outer membrane protein OmpA-like peptidoglycan-associated protein